MIIIVLLMHCSIISEHVLFMPHYCFEHNFRDFFHRKRLAGELIESNFNFVSQRKGLQTQTLASLAVNRKGLAVVVEKVVRTEPLGRVQHVDGTANDVISWVAAVAGAACSRPVHDELCWENAILEAKEFVAFEEAIKATFHNSTSLCLVFAHLAAHHRIIVIVLTIDLCSCEVDHLIISHIYSCKFVIRF